MLNITIVQSKQVVVNNRKVCTITLSDSTVWELKDYMFVDLEEFSEDMEHSMLEAAGWKQQ